MKKKIHPEYQETRVICSCGETFMTRSTQKELKVEICSKCHPFYTGKQKFVDTGGRVERFQKKYGDIKYAPKATPVAEEKADETSEQEPKQEAEEENAAESQDS